MQFGSSHTEIPVLFKAINYIFSRSESYQFLNSRDKDFYLKTAKIFYNKDADLTLLLNRNIGIIGFGSQGSAQAANAVDSGLRVHIGVRNPSAVPAGSHMTVGSIETTVDISDLLVILLPDEVIPEVYQASIRPNLHKGQRLIFAHGYAVHFEGLSFPDFVDVGLVAPSGAGKILRKSYQEGFGIPALAAVHQDISGHCFEYLLAYGKAIGCTRAGIFKSSFAEETETDLFGEQAILTGGLPALVKAAFSVLVKKGIQPEAAWLVCFYELKTIVDLLFQRGFSRFQKDISPIAAYGGKTRGDRIISDHVMGEIENIFDEIRSGAFREEYLKAVRTGKPQSQIRDHIPTLMDTITDEMLDKLIKRDSE